MTPCFFSPFSTPGPPAPPEGVRYHEESVSHDFIRAELRPHFEALSRCRSTAELLTLPLYRDLEPKLRHVLQNPVAGSYARREARAKDRYRAVAWNLERGIELEGQIEEFRHHVYLREAYLLLLTETDVGLARSGNRDVARVLAEALGLHYAFAPCYLNLAKGSGREYDVRGENEIGLHGNAILSRYPLESVRVIPLENGRDKMAGRQKRLGSQSALAVDVRFPGLPL